eukprot:COSAG04_NODE_3_length_53939_cov_50.145431_7_plen_199_part_00
MKEASPAAVVEGPPEFSEHERYLFDLHGVMQVEDALTAEQCDRLNAALDAEIAARQEAGLAFQNSPEWFGDDEEKPAQTLRLGDMADPALDMDKEFLKLVDNPRVSSYLDAMYTSPHFAEGSSQAAAFRIDHIYVDIINPPAWRAAREGKTTDGPIGTGLHKIGLPDAYYRMENGKMYNGLLTVAYQLQDVDPEQGGL